MVCQVLTGVNRCSLSARNWTQLSPHILRFAIAAPGLDFGKAQGYVLRPDSYRRHWMCAYAPSDTIVASSTLFGFPDPRLVVK